MKIKENIEITYISLNTYYVKKTKFKINLNNSEYSGVFVEERNSRGINNKIEWVGSPELEEFDLELLCDTLYKHIS